MGHGAPGHRDTGTPGHRGYRDTGAPGHWDTATPGHQDTGVPGHRATGTAGHRGTGTLGGVHRCPSVPVSHCPGLPVPRCPGVPVPWCPGAPVPRRIAASGLASCVTRGGGVADLKAARAIRAPRAPPRLSRIAGGSLRQGLRHASQGGWQISRFWGHAQDSVVRTSPPALSTPSLGLTVAKCRSLPQIVKPLRGGILSGFVPGSEPPGIGFGGTPRTPLCAPPPLSAVAGAA